ncbi:UNVERIFIED_CONTAM: hypothetical protein Scaly_2832500 [Sesamum calycinum]|uniref:Uncharacterized protein n=1 Tax=Sesamum calycinum TaxID=2727403 RepID=A0AAW2IT95_9LAMI
MKDFPSCFGENGVQVADFSSSNTSRAAQNLVTCVYQCRIGGRSCWITVTWSKNLMGQGLSIGIDDNTQQCLCKVDIKPWLFSKKKGTKSLEADSSKIDIYWDLSSAKFGSGPEPLEGFYVGIVFQTNDSASWGHEKRSFQESSTKAQFCDMGRVHDLVIECDTNTAVEPCLTIRLDTKLIMQVKRLPWKFRGNHTILVDGLAIEVFWDVHNWLFGTSLGNAVFMFKTRESAEKLWASQPLQDPLTLHWSWSQRFQDSQLQSLGFSLILHAWKHE